jgi:Cdc6-like AAA superfamily ATPase
MDMLNAYIEICYEKEGHNVLLYLVNYEKKLFLFNKNVYSGLSGSGKTESCKYIVQHILNRSLSVETALNMKINQVEKNKTRLMKSFIQIWNFLG